MSLKQLKYLASDIVQIEKRTGIDGYGQPIYAAAQDFKCRVVKRPKKVVSSTGEEKVSNTSVYFFETIGAGPEDRVTLPDGTQPPILTVESSPDRTGNRFDTLRTT